MMTGQVYRHAVQLSGQPNAPQEQVLEALCRASVSTLNARLRDGLMPDDCGDDFITAAALMALAAMGMVSEDAPVAQITAGDFTVKKTPVSREAASACLMQQAERIMAPYVKDRFAFMGV